MLKDNNPNKKPKWHYCLLKICAKKVWPESQWWRNSRPTLLQVSQLVHFKNVNSSLRRTREIIPDKKSLKRQDNQMQYVNKILRQLAECDYGLSFRQSSLSMFCSLNLIVILLQLCEKTFLFLGPTCRSLRVWEAWYLQLKRFSKINIIYVLFVYVYVCIYRERE